MTTTYSPSLRLAEMQTGDPAVANNWGNIVNENMTLIENAIVSTVQVPIGGLATYTLTVANGASDQSRPAIQQFTGALTSNCTITYPNVPKFFQAINQTTGGFDIILTAGNGNTVTVPPDSLPYACTCDGNSNILISQVQPGPRYGDFKFSGIAAEGGGWRMGYGQTRPRTDPLWQWLEATGQTSAWVFGTGDGSTTYTMPDTRGQTFFGIDNMGGTAANRVTTASGIAGTTNGATGGNQLLQSHTHGLTINDPGHNHSQNAHAHGVNDPGHSHGVNDPGHSHGVNDGGHSHGVNDGGHSHGFQTQTNGGGGADGIPDSNAGAGAPNGNTFGSGSNIGIQSSGSNIGIQGSGTGIGIDGSGTGIGIAATTASNNPSGTGITGSAAAAGSGNSQNMPPTMMATCLIFVGA